MSLTNQERINSYSQILQALVVGSPKQAWYESQLFYETSIISEQVLNLDDVKLLKQNPASNLTTARNNALVIPSVLSDLSQFSNAVRLTPVPGTNGMVYVALSVYGDFNSTRLKLWIQPQMVPQLSGLPSNGYAIRLFNGNPNSGGTEITTTQGTSGTGINKSVGWIPIASAGILIVAEDFVSNISDPYWCGFRYIGRTLGSTVRKQYFNNVNFIQINNINDISQVQIWTSVSENAIFDQFVFDYTSFNILDGNSFEKYDNYNNIIYNKFYKSLVVYLSEFKSGYVLIGE
jgi:hypothetical protein